LQFSLNLQQPVKMGSVRPKKYLGQHFLKDGTIAGRIVDALDANDLDAVIEVGPGTGILTSRLIKKQDINLILVEIDDESVAYLNKLYKEDQLKIISGDFLQLPLQEISDGSIGVIGNFPYNISSQIFFKVLKHRTAVHQVVGMVQKEVGQRIASGPGNKTYGILSVLLQAFYDVEYMFEVPPEVFHPPPKVHSAVLRLRRNGRTSLSCDEDLFFRVVKQGFQNRRKTLRNALKPLNLPAEITGLAMLDLRAEALSCLDFENLTLKIQESGRDHTL